MTPQQSTLPLVGASSRRPKVDQLVPLVLEALDGKGWVTRRQLQQQYGWDDRTIREAANQSQGRIISGQKGYALVDCVTVHEAQHAADWLKHQAHEMLKRAADIQRAMHRRWAA